MIMLEDMMLIYETRARKNTLTARDLAYDDDFDLLRINLGLPLG